MQNPHGTERLGRWMSKVRMFFGIAVNQSFLSCHLHHVAPPCTTADSTDWAWVAGGPPPTSRGAGRSLTNDFYVCLCSRACVCVCVSVFVCVCVECDPRPARLVPGNLTAALDTVCLGCIIRAWCCPAGATQEPGGGGFTRGFRSIIREYT